MSTPSIDVAVCVVQTPDGRVLLAERTRRQVAAGFWELPGGKIESGESPLQAAARELQEETGLVPAGLQPFLSYDHPFPTRLLRLRFFRAQSWQGSPHGREGQRLAWADPAAPHVGPILPSNDRALFALGLPSVYLLADICARSRADSGLAALRDALDRGETLIHLRIGAAAPGQAASLLARVAALAADYPAARLFASSPTEARHAGLAGVHSSAQALRRLAARPPVTLWAATCHDDADLARAVSLGADFVVLSPIERDPEQPWLAPIGWEGLRRHAATLPCRIYAQGGLSRANARMAQQAGAAGVAIRCDAARPPDERVSTGRAMTRVEMRV